MKYSCNVLGVEYRVKKLFVKIKLICYLEEKAVVEYNGVLSITQDNFQVLTVTFLTGQNILRAMVHFGAN